MPTLLALSSSLNIGESSSKRFGLLNGPDDESEGPWLVVEMFGVVVGWTLATDELGKSVNRERQYCTNAGPIQEKLDAWKGACGVKSYVIFAFTYACIYICVCVCVRARVRACVRM